MSSGYERPPREGDPEKLLLLCEILREGDLPRSELYEESDHSESTTSDNIRYGVLLGFLKESEDSVEATQMGVEASYNQDSPEKLAVQFQDGITKYPLYSELLHVISGDRQEGEEGNIITKSEILKKFRTSFRIEGSESSLTEAATTFLKTLEKAGLGEYIVGRRGKETRLEIIEDFYLLAPGLDQKEEENNVSEVDEPSSAEGSSMDESKTQAQPVQRNISSSGFDFHISFEITADDDPEQVEKLILAIRRGLSADLEVAQDSEETQKPGQNNEQTEGAQEVEGNEQAEEDSESSDSPDSSLNSFMESEREHIDEGSSEP